MLILLQNRRTHSTSHNASCFYRILIFFGIDLLIVFFTPTPSFACGPVYLRCRFCNEQYEKVCIYPKQTVTLQQTMTDNRLYDPAPHLPPVTACETLGSISNAFDSLTLDQARYSDQPVTQEPTLIKEEHSRQIPSNVEQLYLEPGIYLNQPNTQQLNQQEDNHTDQTNSNFNSDTLDSHYCFLLCRNCLNIKFTKRQYAFCTANGTCRTTTLFCALPAILLIQCFKLSFSTSIAHNLTGSLCGAVGLSATVTAAVRCYQCLNSLHTAKKRNGIICDIRRIILSTLPTGLQNYYYTENHQQYFEIMKEQLHWCHRLATLKKFPSKSSMTLAYLLYHNLDHSHWFKHYKNRHPNLKKDSQLQNILNKISEKKHCYLQASKKTHWFTATDKTLNIENFMKMHYRFDPAGHCFKDLLTETISNISETVITNDYSITNSLLTRFHFDLGVILDISIVYMLDDSDDQMRWFLACPEILGCEEPVALDQDQLKKMIQGLWGYKNFKNISFCIPEILMIEIGLIPNKTVPVPSDHSDDDTDTDTTNTDYEDAQD